MCDADEDNDEDENEDVNENDRNLLDDLWMKMRNN